MMNVMWDDAAIQSWYATPPGQKLVRKLLRQLKTWPALRWSGREPPAVLALGHADVLEPLWPGDWEFPDRRSSNRYDRVVLMHDPMFDSDPTETLNACWREVVPGGLVLLVLSNKWSLARWSQSSPLGHGKSYRAGRVNKLVREAGFTLLDHVTLVPGWPGGAPTWLPFPALLRVALLRKDEPAVTRLRLRPMKNPVGLAPAGN